MKGKRFLFKYLASGYVEKVSAKRAFKISNKRVFQNNTIYQAWIKNIKQAGVLKYKEYFSIYEGSCFALEITHAGGENKKYILNVKIY